MKKLQLTKGVEQAFCIIVLLATQETKAPLASDEISRRLAVSPSYLKKITRKMVVKNIIASVPGNNGGLSLAKSLSQITLLDVIEAMEGPLSMYPDTGLINLAFKGGKHLEQGTDVIRQVFEQADHLLAEYFSKITAEDLLKAGFAPDGFPTLNWNHVSLDQIE